MNVVHNPVLRGFHPDPSILRVGEDYYIASSTFEWWPGVRIHHSRDLVHWRHVAYVLDRPSQLDLRGDPDSGGVWAPCLTYADGLFHLVYTDVKSWGLHDPFKDTHNYLVTAERVTGPWSDPVRLNSSGFDPSLFHDEDGRKWLTNMVWDHRKGREPFAGIVLQEYSPRERRLVGTPMTIFKGTALRVTEGPHLYRRDGWYYLLTAEGGTSYDHAVTVARSRSLLGPYEVDPLNPILTSAGRPELELQKAGHASLVETQTGEWYLAHLCGRPLEPLGRCNLGRETALQRCEWTPDGWLRLEGGGNSPLKHVRCPNLPAQAVAPEPERDDFDAPELGPHWQTLRRAASPDWLSLADRPGHLRLHGRESLASLHRQSLVARRLQSFRAEASTCVEFEPDTFQQMAGLVCIYDTRNYLYLRVSRDERLGKSLNVLISDNGSYDEALVEDVSVEGWPRCHLKVAFDRDVVRFFFSADGAQWRSIGPQFDAGKLSDEHCGGLGFTGTFIGLCVQDLSGVGKQADFDYFEYFEHAGASADVAVVADVALQSTS